MRMIGSELERLETEYTEALDSRDPVRIDQATKAYTLAQQQLFEQEAPPRPLLPGDQGKPVREARRP